MTTPTYRIQGGAGPLEAAAVAAAIEHDRATNEATRRRRPKETRRSAWQRAGGMLTPDGLPVLPAPDPGLNWPDD